MNAMYLTPTSVLPYLASRGLIDNEAIVSGDLRIIESLRNNRSLRVLRRSGPSFFIKQIQQLDPLAIECLKREATIYCEIAASKNATFESIQQIVPAFEFFDETRHALVTECLTNAVSVHDYHNSVRDYPTEVAVLIGESLAVYHSEPGRQLANVLGDRLGQDMPWILSFHEDQGDGNLSGGTQQLLEIIQSDEELISLLEYVAACWHVDGLIHRDVKWNNLLLVNQAPQLKLLDWEMATLGDWHWDVGMAIQNWWSFEALASGEDAPVEAQKFLEYSDQMARIRPALRAFEEAWSRNTSDFTAEHHGNRDRLRAFAAARMLQTTYEILHQMTSMNHRTRRLVNLSRQFWLDIQSGAATAS